MRRRAQQPSGSFEASYPTVPEWVRDHGWIEIGYDESGTGSSVRALDPGGLILKTISQFASMDRLLEKTRRKTKCTEILKRIGRTVS